MFLLKEWQRNHYGPVLAKKTVTNPDHLQGRHEETDTLIAFHASRVAGNVMVRASCVGDTSWNEWKVQETEYIIELNYYGLWTR